MEGFTLYMGKKGMNYAVGLSDFSTGRELFDRNPATHILKKNLCIKLSMSARLWRFCRFGNLEAKGRREGPCIHFLRSLHDIQNVSRAFAQRFCDVWSIALNYYLYQLGV